MYVTYVSTLCSTMTLAKRQLAEIDEALLTTTCKHVHTHLYMYICTYMRGFGTRGVNCDGIVGPAVLLFKSR